MLLLTRYALHSSPSLHYTGNRLSQPKNYGQKQHQCGNPERVPLYLLPVIIPPGVDRLWLRIVKDLFQHDKSVFPVMEALCLPRGSVEGSIASCSAIKT